MRERLSYVAYQRDVSLYEGTSKAAAIQAVWADVRQHIVKAQQQRRTSYKDYLSYAVFAYSDRANTEFLVFSGSFYPLLHQTWNTSAPKEWLVACETLDRTRGYTERFFHKSEAVRFARTRSWFAPGTICLIRRIGIPTWLAEFRDGRVVDTNDETLPFEALYDENNNRISYAPYVNGEKPCSKQHTF